MTGDTETEVNRSSGNPCPECGYKPENLIDQATHWMLKHKEDDPLYVG